MARWARDVEFWRDYDSATQRTCVRLRFSGLLPGFASALREAVLLFGEDDEDDGPADELHALRDAIATFEVDLEGQTFRVPELIDWFHANLVSGAYYAMRSEAPDYYAEQLAAHPERSVGFFRSGYSASLGAAVYASTDSWVVPADIELDRFLEQTGQRYRTAGLLDARLLTMDGQTWMIADGVAVSIDLDALFRSRVCASFASAKIEEDDGLWGEDAFRKWGRPSGAATCQIESTGSLAVVSDIGFRHVFFDLRPLKQPETQLLVDAIGGMAGLAAKGLEAARPLGCDWSTLSDETFEHLCYDLIRAHPRFDADSIRRFGKSRSRDGGRDIEVREIARPGAADRPRKWIFQCKLISNNASLTATRLTDIGDMLDHYAAEGFGVLTSGPIDATLYDKLDAVCSKRGVEQLNMSILELERALASQPVVRARYFPTA